ncbi:MAG: ankyrin repeat domain-containing protein [Kiritimatiellia bacterium]
MERKKFNRLLKQACRLHERELIQQAISYGADIDLSVDPAGYTPLTRSILMGDTDLALWLLDQGADPNMAVESTAYTPLMLAAELGNVQVAKQLLRKGADANRTTPDGISAFLLAVARGQGDIIDPIGGVGAHWKERDADGWSAVEYIRAYGKGTEGDRYWLILPFFTAHSNAFGEAEAALLRLIPPADRCLILERLLLRLAGNPVFVADELVDAYLAAGWETLAGQFIIARKKSGRLDTINLTRGLDAFERIHQNQPKPKTYADCLPALRQADGEDSLLRAFLVKLCEGNEGHDLPAEIDFDESDDEKETRPPETEQFISERNSFIQAIENRRRWNPGK